MPTRHGSSFAKNAAIWSRLTCLRATTLPRSSTAWIWNTFFAKSRPTVVTFMLDAYFVQVVDQALPLWHIDAVASGGVHLTESGHSVSSRQRLILTKL